MRKLVIGGVLAALVVAAQALAFAGLLLVARLLVLLVVAHAACSVRGGASDHGRRAVNPR